MKKRKGYLSLFRLPRKGKGQGVIEMALVLPVLLGFGTLTIDLANLVLTAHRITAAVREGARVATETSTPWDPSIATCTPNSDINPTNCTPSCGLNTQTAADCADNDTSTCCIAVSRANIVLFNSGVTDGIVRGTWLERDIGGTQYAFLRIEMEATVNFFFGIGSQTIRQAATGFHDEIT